MAAAGAPDTLGTLRAALESKRASARELVLEVFARARTHDATLRAFMHPRRDAALAEADAADARRARGQTRGALDGIPVAIKDNIVQAGEPASCASRMLENYRSPFSATVVERLARAGAIIVARTNMDEFAMGSSTENSVRGASRNPWDVARAPGGSSGGSAVAVSAGFVPLALGSDTGGSIRQPASFCGITGMKPSYGRVSRYGLVAFASSLDQIGPLAHSAADCALALAAIAGADPRDATALPEPAPAAARAQGGEVKNLRVGVPEDMSDTPGVAPAMWEHTARAVAELERAGARRVSVALPHARYALAAYYVISTAEASSNLARFDGARYGFRASAKAATAQPTATMQSAQRDAVHRATASENSSVTEMYERTRTEGFGAEVKRRILLGTYALSAGYYDAYYKKAQQVRTLLLRDFEAAFQTCDVIALPTTPQPSFLLGEKSDPLAMYYSDVFTVPANLTGLPSISLPCGFEAGLPVGLQLVGRPRADAELLRVADAYQRRTEYHEQRPPL